MGKAESKEKIHWVRDIEKAVLIAGFTGKPVFLMILKSLCPTCQAIEPKYVSSKEFRALSKFFVMKKKGRNLWGILINPKHVVIPSARFEIPSLPSLSDQRKVAKGFNPKKLLHITLPRKLSAKSVDQAQVEELYAPDGQYVPRVIFLDTTGKPMNEFYNLGANHAETRYFYPQADDIVKTMRKVLYYFYPYNKSED